MQIQAKALLELRQRKQGYQTPYFKYEKDPLGFAVDVLKIRNLTHEQKTILISVRDNSETNVQACHGVGKTFISAVIVLWWVLAVGGKAITTAPTENQVKNLLWSEIRELHGSHRLAGVMSTTTLNLTEKARAYGFTSREYSPDSFQGIHGERLLAIQDEANGIAQMIDDGFESCVTGSDNRGLRIGNPVTPNTPFHKACKNSKIKISAWSHPNVSWAYQKNVDGIHVLKPDVKARIMDDKGEVLPQDQWPKEFPKDIIPGAVSISWIEKQRKKKGVTSSYWLSRVEGEFPEDSAFALIPKSWFMAARARYDANPDAYKEGAKRHGVDVGDGSDPHAYATMRGDCLAVVEEQVTTGDEQDNSRCVAHVKQIAQKDESINVDNIGVGAGVVSALRDGGYKAAGFNFADGSKEEGLLNKRAEAFWTLRKAFRDGNIAIAPLGDDYEDQLMDELSEIQYVEMANGKIKIEDKKSIIKRLGRSPNLADAVCYAFNKGNHAPNMVPLKIAF